MSGQGLESSQENSLCTATQMKQLVGGSVSKVLSRSSLFSLSSDTDDLYAAVSDEASNSVRFLLSLHCFSFSIHIILLYGLIY